MSGHHAPGSVVGQVAGDGEMDGGIVEYVDEPAQPQPDGRHQPGADEQVGGECPALESSVGSERVVGVVRWRCWRSSIGHRESSHKSFPRLAAL